MTLKSPEPKPCRTCRWNKPFRVLLIPFREFDRCLNPHVKEQPLIARSQAFTSGELSLSLIHISEPTRPY